MHQPEYYKNSKNIITIQLKTASFKDRVVGYHSFELTQRNNSQQF